MTDSRMYWVDFAGFQYFRDLWLPVHRQICRLPVLHDRTLIERLMKNGITVCLVSGGLLPLVMHVASALRIPKENVYANRLIFSENGNYKDFDRTLLTSRTEGKAEVVRSLMQRYNSLVAVVGDGMTDARACPPAEVFIGFGANVERPTVKASTPFFCTSVPALTELLEFVGLLDPVDQIVKQK